MRTGAEEVFLERKGSIIRVTDQRRGTLVKGVGREEAVKRELT